MTGIDASAPWSARVAVLGPVSAIPVDGSGLAPAPGPRGKALLAALVLEAPRTVSTERLIELIWADDPPRGARAALQALVSRTRAAFGDVIGSSSVGYALAVDRGDTDLGRAEALLDRARTEVDADALVEAGAVASTALGLWRDEPAADLPDGPLADELRSTAQALQDDLELLLVRCELDLGRGAEVEPLARGLAGRRAFDDAVHLLLMRCLDDAGRSTDALGVYATFRERVREAFGSEPAVELQHLHLELLDREASATPLPDRAPRPDQASTRAARPRLVRGVRAAPNALLGREDDLRRIEQLLGEARVTTVLGPGGIGKTRVAQEVARRSTESRDAVVVVELAGVRTGDDVVFALGTALGIREVASARRLGDRVVLTDLGDRIRSALEGLDALLVLDNCEHVIDAAAGWCAALTADLPGLTVLATSRTPLALSSERIYALPPLGLRPGAEGRDPAVELFLARATAARPDAMLPRDEVARLCARLDGLPLAIELAAARIRSMPLDEVARRLSNRFALLTTGDRAAPERHRTLLAVIEWSWNLLGTSEQRALARLSEFADGFGLDAAAAILAEGPGAEGRDEDAAQDALDALVAQSLLLVTEHESGVRFRMLETVREFGRLQLARRSETELAQDRVLAWAAEFATVASRGLSGHAQVETFRRIRVEEDNLLDALRRAMSAGRADVVAQLFALLGYYWSLRSAHSEVISLGPTVLSALRRYEPDDDTADATALALAILASTLLIAQHPSGVLALGRLRRVVAAHPPADPRIAAMCGLILTLGRRDLIGPLVADALESTDPHTTLFGSLAAASNAENDGRPDDAEAFARRGVVTARSLGDTWGEAMASMMLAQLDSQAGRAEDAIAWAQRAREGLALLGADDDLRQIDWTIATNEVALGRIEEAEQLFRAVAESPGRNDEVELRSIGLAGLAEIARVRGDLPGAVALYRESLGTFDSARSKASPWFRIGLSSLLALLVDAGAPPEQTRGLARRLRSRTLATLRQSPDFVDRPVLGASLVGLAMWVAAERVPDDLTPLDPHLAVRLLALAETLSARQDTPTLRLAGRFEELADRFSTEEVAAARAEASATEHDERPGLVAALLREPGPWSYR